MQPGAARGGLANPAKFPEGLEYLWAWFLELSFTGRAYLSGTPLPLSNGEIWAWCQLNRAALEPWELRAVRLLDTAWLAARRQDK